MRRSVGISMGFKLLTEEEGNWLECLHMQTCELSSGSQILT